MELRPRPQTDEKTWGGEPAVCMMGRHGSCEMSDFPCEHDSSRIWMHRRVRNLRFWPDCWHGHRLRPRAMNNGNALGFLVLGAAMCLLPFLVPAWFHHVAMDGSSTRALWCETVGAVQCLIGVVYLTRQGVIAAMSGLRTLAEARRAIATADWAGRGLPGGVVNVNFGVDASARIALPITHRLPTTPALAGDAPRWLALGRIGGGEARLTNLVGRAGEVRQAA